jgi:hypothetical protein
MAKEYVGKSSSPRFYCDWRRGLTGVIVLRFPGPSSSRGVLVLSVRARGVHMPLQRAASSAWSRTRLLARGVVGRQSCWRRRPTVVLISRFWAPLWSAPSAA